MTTMIADKASDTLITDDEIEAFTYGDCWRLALAMQKRYGLPVAFYAGIPAMDPNYTCDDETMWCHAFNVLPDGRYIDVNGISSAEEIDAKWQSCLWLDDGASPRIIIPNDAELALMLSDFEAMYPEEDADVTAETLGSLLDS